jgi:hypothetical protein
LLKDATKIPLHNLTREVLDKYSKEALIDFVVGHKATFEAELASKKKDRKAEKL